MKRVIAFLLVALMLLTTGCSAGEPWPEDVYFGDIYSNGLLVGGGGLEIDPIFTASPAFGITAGNIVTWNGHPALTTGTHGMGASTIVGTALAQNLTNKNITMLNSAPIYWDDTAGVDTEVFELWADDNLHIFDAVEHDIFVWQGAGTGQRLFLWPTASTAISTTKDSPTLDFVANYWDGGNANWEAKIINNMITAGVTPKSRLEFEIQGEDILRLENDTGVVKAYLDGVLDMTAHSVIDISKLNLTDPTELTIAAGAITVTQGFHTVDTQGDTSSDYLDTINGGVLGDILYLSGANDAREVIITRNGNIRFQPDHLIEGFGFISPLGSSGTFYSGGYYNAPVTDANLTQASTTVAYGSANAPGGAHAFLVAAAAGTTNAGTVSIVVSGTTITSAGVRAAGSETIVADITTMGVNSYYQTTKKWLGTVTYTLTPAGGAAIYAADFNYGFAVYDSFDSRLGTIKLIEVFGRAGANDNGFDIQLLHHKFTGWTYSAAAFVPGTGAVVSLVGDYATDNDLVTNERFAWERELSETVDGSNQEGFIIKVVTTANKAVELMNISIYAEAVPNDVHLKTTGQSVQLLFNGTNWMKN